MDLPLVPAAFIRILKGTLAKMAGEGVVPFDHVNLQFWDKIPRKFNCKNNKVIPLINILGK